MIMDAFDFAIEEGAKLGNCSPGSFGKQQRIGRSKELRHGSIIDKARCMNIPSCQNHIAGNPVHSGTRTEHPS